MDPTSTIMGADGNIFTALDTLCQRNNPQAIVLLSTGLSEAQGSDLSRVVRQFREEYPRHKGVAILTVNTPDFYGSMENGFSAVLESIIEQWVAPAPRPLRVTAGSTCWSVTSARRAISNGCAAALKPLACSR
jgi:nitrogenase molybdenum-iron protein NifN